MIVILYVMDSLRPDFLSCYGYAKETSPNIDKIAREGVLFRNAFAQSTWTRSSGASLLSSLYPSAHGVFTVDDYLGSGIPMVQEQLKSAGFKTAAISSIGNISPAFGFGRGFGRFVELYKDQTLLEKRTRIKVRGGDNDYGSNHFRVTGDYVPVSTSEDINRYLIPIIEDGKDENIFVLAWSMDTHNPYFQRDPVMARFHKPSKEILWSKDIQNSHTDEAIDRLKAFYEEMIYYNDHHLGLLIKKLKELDLFEETFLILTGDHGEAFGEHGFNSHSGWPYDEQIRVPLIMKFPHSRFSGEVNSLVQLIDLAPTILECTSVDAGDMMIQGKSLLPVIGDRAESNEPVFSEVQITKAVHSFIAGRTREYKYIEVRRPHLSFRTWLKNCNRLWPSPWFVYKPCYLFQLAEDSEEKTNIIGPGKQVVDHFSSRVKNMLKESRKIARALRKNRPVDIVPPDPEVAKQLQALGYFD